MLNFLYVAHLYDCTALASTFGGRRREKRNTREGGRGGRSGKGRKKKRQGKELKSDENNFENIYRLFFARRA